MLPGVRTDKPRRTMLRGDGLMGGFERGLV
jgi:hypothetical protein